MNPHICSWPSHPRVRPTPDSPNSPNASGGASDRANALPGLELPQRGTSAAAAPLRGVFLDSRRVQRTLGGGASPNTHTVAADTGIRTTGCLQEPKCTERNKRAAIQRAFTMHSGYSAKVFARYAAKLGFGFYAILTCFLCVPTICRKWSDTLALPEPLLPLLGVGNCTSGAHPLLG